MKIFGLSLIILLSFICVNVNAQGDLVVDGGSVTVNGVGGSAVLNEYGFSLRSEQDRIQGTIFETFRSRGSSSNKQPVLSSSWLFSFDSYYYYGGYNVLGARWGATMDGLNRTKFFFWRADKAEFDMPVEVQGMDLKAKIEELEARLAVLEGQ